MGKIYFCFSDECGDYKKDMTDRQAYKHPFYIRTTLIINALEWKSMNRSFKELKQKYGLSQVKEIKWSHPWSLRYFQRNNKTIPDGHVLKHYGAYDYHHLIDFIEESIRLINVLADKKIIITYTSNSSRFSNTEQSMLSFHLQEHMQRIEMELQNDPHNLGVLFFDPISSEKNEMFRTIYNDLYHDGDFITNYQSIKDSLNIENSHHSVGIQIADYISGAFSSILKCSEKNDYSRGLKMFFESVFPNLRRDSKSNVHGYGIREVPSSSHIRTWLRQQLDYCGARVQHL